MQCMELIALYYTQKILYTKYVLIVNKSAKSALTASHINDTEIVGLWLKNVTKLLKHNN